LTPAVVESPLRRLNLITIHPIDKAQGGLAKEQAEPSRRQTVSAVTTWISKIQLEVLAIPRWRCL